MGLVYYGIHEPVALLMRKKYGLCIFVETGTWCGDSAKWASKYFSEVYTIELDFGLWQRSNDRLKECIGVCNIHGNSRVELSKIIPELSLPTLFFLDAHWTGDAEQQDEHGSCAVMDEIAAINELCKVPHVIIVDDVRMMTGGWADKGDIVKALYNNGKRDVQIKDDIFLGEPCGVTDKGRYISKGAMWC